MSNGDIYYEGWLFKSPPTYSIWRARWRRRWFTLKNGEIPGQFFLMYYADRSCKHYKGKINLDECEQVDAGLSLNHRKQKFEFMFIVKTPPRIYYLAADSSEEMKMWVECICQVCNLQDDSKTETPAPLPTTSPSLPIYMNNESIRDLRHNQQDSVAPVPHQNNNQQSYQNVTATRNDVSYFNVLSGQAVQRSLSQTLSTVPKIKNYVRQNSHNRSQSLVDEKVEIKKPNNTGAIKKIPENLKLNGSSLNESFIPSPTSGPYIPISECYSGSPVLLPNVPHTPLNSLNPRFGDTPRSNRNICLNLPNEQSPKINNFAATEQPSASGRSSPGDSESVFTDDEEHMHQTPIVRRSGLDRSLRPSDSSIENDSVVFTYSQRFSKQPEEKGVFSQVPPPRPVKNRDSILTDSAEPIYENKGVSQEPVGPKEQTSFVEESYDIPRSHHMPYYNMNSDGGIAKSPQGYGSSELRSLSPEKRCTDSATLRPSKHFYTNAAPTKVEGNVFRYDFYEQTPSSPAPVVNRNLKPKKNTSNGESTLKREDKHKVLSPSFDMNSMHTPPSVDRALKPGNRDPHTPNISKRKPSVNSMYWPSDKNDMFHGNPEATSKTLPRDITLASLTIAPPKTHAVLEYLDLDPDSLNKTSSASTSSSNANNIHFKSIPEVKSMLSKPVKLTAPVIKGEPGTVYNKVDFKKTEAFIRTKEKAEMNRANRLNNSKGADDDKK